MEITNHLVQEQSLRSIFGSGGAKLMIVVAHPDDETVAVGGRLDQLRAARFIHVTDGAPHNGYDARQYRFPSIQDYRSARRQELARAYAIAGIPEGRSVHFDIPDQQAVFHLPEIVEHLIRQIATDGPVAVLTHPYEGGHPDHDACAVAVHTAVRRMAAGQRPMIVEACFYHAGANGIETGCFLPGGPPELTCRLSEPECDLKRQLLAAFTTQQQTLQYFGTEIERFRTAPAYDFSKAPHEGKLFYDCFDWGVTGEEFRARAIALRSEVRPCA